MFLSYITLAVALSLSVIAAYYSIAGLTAIFAAAVIPIIVMGSILELGKVVVTLWLHEYWRQCRLLMKMYLVSAVAVLMLITSMGIFGFLSKAHSDQSLISGDVVAKISTYDEKIKTAKDNIDANRKALKQMDEAVDQVMARSSSETGAEKAVGIRRSQQKERARLQSDIQAEQKIIATYSEERAPIAAEVRKVEAEVGPLKYIAALVYGGDTDTNALEAAVRWVIVLLVIVFDPLAIMLLLAATESLKWEKQRVFDLLRLPAPPAVTEPDLTAVNHMLASAAVVPEPIDPAENHCKIDVAETEKSILEQYPYVLEGFAHFKDLTPMVYKPDSVGKSTTITSEDDDLVDEHPDVKAAVKLWKEANPDSTIKEQRTKLLRGEIDQLPWLELVEHTPVLSSFGFGSTFPTQSSKGDTFVRTDCLPNQVYKFNGTSWITVDKNINDSYTYDEAYVDYLIEKISAGEYDTELLSNSEREQVATRLQTNNEK
jgi:hypothetical protein